MTPHDEPLAEAPPLTPASIRRRPSGEPPPLPRPVSISTRVYLVLGGVVAGLTLALTTVTGTRSVTAGDLAVTRAVERSRWEPLTSVGEALVSLGSLTTFRVLAWATLIVLLASRRFQHLFVTLGLLLAVPVVAADLSERVARMRPAGVEIIGRWEGFAYPSRPVTEFALVLTVAVGLLVPPGPWRRRAALTAIVAIVLVAVARIYVAVDHPSDVAAGLVLGAALPAVALRLVTPQEMFPVSYRRGARAHLDVSGRRGDAIRRAVSRQLGVDISAVEPFSLGASAGSTPLCLITRSGGALFGKLYAANHVRSDRWYKLGRTIRYGRLEDERPFNSVRRLVQYEDHMLRVLRDAGVPTATPYGIVEITPEREYVLVAEMIRDAVELDQTDVTDDVADQALEIVRMLWNAGLAHRDIKPGNLLVADGRVYLIDAAFAEIRPTPWRSAVDLANMMLTLSLRMPAERVYERALRWFTEDEIAEAFAASRSVTVPSQLRRLLRAAPHDPTSTFCALAPPRPPVAIQRWSLRRIGLTAAVAMAVAVAAALFVANLRLAGLL